MENWTIADMRIGRIGKPAAQTSFPVEDDGFRRATTGVASRVGAREQFADTDGAPTLEHECH